MGLFAQKECCLCGGKAGSLTGVRLADGKYICKKCFQEKCSGIVSYEMFKSQIREEDLPPIIEARMAKEKRYGQFQVTRTILNCEGSGILADEIHGWWIPVSAAKWAIQSPQESIIEKRPAIFEFRQYQGYKMKILTNEQEHEPYTDYSKLPRPRPEFPTSTGRNAVTHIELEFNLANELPPAPYISDLILYRWGISPEKKAIQGYQLADEILTFLEQHQS